MSAVFENIGQGRSLASTINSAVSGDPSSITAALSSIPGLPPLPPSISAALFATPSLSSIESAAGAGPLLSTAAQVWGVYDSENKEAIDQYDTVVSIDYNTESRMLSYPVEEGAFETYDKVSVPDRIGLRYACGLDIATRTALLQQLTKLKQSYDLVTVITPVTRYPSMNCSKFNYRHDLSTSNMIVVDVFFEQIVVTAVGTYANGQPIAADNAVSATSADPISLGATAPQQLGSSLLASAAPFNLPTDVSGAVSGAQSQVSALQTSVKSQISAIVPGVPQSLIPMPNLNGLTSSLGLPPAGQLLGGQ